MALVKSQCCLRGDVSLLETTELLTKLPPADLFNIMSCKVTHCSALISDLKDYYSSKHELNWNKLHLNLHFFFSPHRSLI